MKEIVECPICHKTIAKIENKGNMEKVYLWCRRCKKELYIENFKEMKK